MATAPALPQENQAAQLGTAPSLPRYYRVQFWAEHLDISSKSLTRLLKDDPDVREISDKKKGTRRYRTLLIPESSVRRVLDRLKPRSN
jgi:hypothetical protein